MSTFNIVAAVGSELVALIVIVGIWRRRPLKVVSSLLWSVLLLLPFFGLVAYFFLREGPEPHPYRIPVTDGAANGGVDTGHGGHSGHSL